MVRTLTSLFVAIVLFAGMAGAQDIDDRIGKQVDKVLRYPSSKKQLDKLAFYYHEANKADRERIMELKESGRPDIWPELFFLYSRLSKRQETVGKLPPGPLKAIGFEKRDFSADIESSRKNAAAYLYADAERLLKSGERENAQKAYGDLMMIARLYDEYRDLDILVRQAVILGADRIDTEVHNRTKSKFSTAMINAIGAPLSKVKREEKPRKDEKYHSYTIQVVLEDLKITNPQIKTEMYAEERDVIDSEGMVIDTIGCEVTETFQRKAALLKGKVIFIDEMKGQSVNTVPVAVESVFLHKYATVTGNIDACGQETRALLMKKEADYPSDEKMAMDAVMEFRDKLALILLQQEQSPEN